MTPDQVEEMLQGLAEGFHTWPRAPILDWPDEEGLDYEEVSFLSEDEGGARLSSADGHAIRRRGRGVRAPGRPRCTSGFGPS
jgi:hypothetical protein